MTAPPSIARVAHAYGNNRASLERALNADCEMIEVDMWYRDGELYIHHERRLDPFPLLYDRVMKGHALGPYSLRLGNYFVRPDIGTLRFDDLLDAAIGKKRLLLDAKGGHHSANVGRYVETLERKIRERKAEEWVAICGQTFPILNAFREAAPDIEVRYSIQQRYQWESFLHKMDRDPIVRKVCIAYGFIDAKKARILEERDIDTYCWTVDDWGAAKRLVQMGVDGIISNDLLLLKTLPEWMPVTVRTDPIERPGPSPAEA